MAHGCQAGLYPEALNEVLCTRIQRGEKYYSTYKLGAIASDVGAFSWFLDDHAQKVTESLLLKDRAFVHRQLGYGWRSLGRPCEAMKHYEAALGCLERLGGELREVATTGGLLSELLLQLGKGTEAVKMAEKSVKAADAMGDPKRRAICYTHWGNALLQTGDMNSCRVAFVEAERIARESSVGQHKGEDRSQQDQAAEPALSLGNNYRFCDWLLDRRNNSEEVIRRVKRTRAKERQDEDTRGAFARGFRAIILGRAFAQRKQHGDKERAERLLRHSVKELRNAARDDFMPRALLELTRVLDSQDEIRTRLDEAWEIAERGYMKLHMADILLYRARLFGSLKCEVRSVKYPWESLQADLAAARKLIEQCGYHRRDEELADAEEAAKSW